MKKQYQGNAVTVQREARQGDAGFDASKNPQSLIQLADGTNRVVQNSELS